MVKRIFFHSPSPYRGHLKPRKTYYLNCFTATFGALLAVLYLGWALSLSVSIPDDTEIDAVRNLPVESFASTCLVAVSPRWDAGQVLDWCSPAQGPLDFWVPCEQLQQIHEAQTIVLVQTNCGYVDFAINLWRAYVKLGRHNILFIATDCHAYRALVKHVGELHVAKPLAFAGRSMVAAQAFNSSDYRRFTVGRAILMQYFIDRGFNVLWQDVDSVVIRDPFDFLPPRTPALDLIVTNDSANTANPADNQMCSCFVYVMANRTGSTWFLKRWYDLTLEGAGLNQPSMNRAMYEALDPEIYGSRDFVHLVLPKMFFPNGATMWKYNRTAYWAHANWRVGRGAKLDFIHNFTQWMADDVTCPAKFS